MIYYCDGIVLLVPENPDSVLEKNFLQNLNCLTPWFAVFLERIGEANPAGENTSFNFTCYV